MIIYILSGIIAALCFIIILQSVIHRFERKDLYNRIMSKDYSEYKGGKCGYAPSAHNRVLERWRRRKDGRNE